MKTKHVIHKAKTALLIVDMINPLDFPQGKQLLKHSIDVAKNIAALKARAKKKKIPTIYVNDNFDQWQSDWKRLYESCQRDDCLGKPLSTELKPDSDDYFVLKPVHSAFFRTVLETLLRQLETKKLIITGVATDMCILFSAYDAYIRDFEVIVPHDCTAAESTAQKKHALELMKRVLKIKSPTAAHVRF